jgi:hypothetical protein
MTRRAPHLCNSLTIRDISSRCFPCTKLARYADQEACERKSLCRYSHCASSLIPRRKRRLIKGPREFRDLRADLPKNKTKTIQHCIHGSVNGSCHLSAVLMSFVTKHHKLASPLLYAGAFFRAISAYLQNTPAHESNSPKGRSIFVALSPHRRYSL